MNTTSPGNNSARLSSCREFSRSQRVLQWSRDPCRPILNATGSLPTKTGPSCVFACAGRAVLLPWTIIRLASCNQPVSSICISLKKNAHRQRHVALWNYLAGNAESAISVRTNESGEKQTVFEGDNQGYLKVARTHRALSLSTVTVWIRLEGIPSPIS